MSELKLRDWIDIEKIEWEYMSSNPNAINFLKKHPDKIDWSLLSLNINGIDLLKENFDKIWKIMVN